MTENSAPASIDQHTDPGDGQPAAWLTVPEVGERLGLGVSRVHQLVRDGNVVAVRRDGGPLRIPADFIGVDSDGRPAVVKHLSGVITLLRDFRYTDEEIITWLFTADDTLPGTPAGALKANRGTEVKRRAQAAGF